MILINANKFNFPLHTPKQRIDLMYEGKAIKYFDAKVIGYFMFSLLWFCLCHCLYSVCFHRYIIYLLVESRIRSNFENKMKQY